MQAEMYPSDKFSGTVHYCLWCFSTEKLSRCSRCGNAYYCSRDHQVQHWKIHRKDCKKPPAPSETVSNIGSVTNTPVSETVSKSVSQSVDELSFSGWINNNIISQDSVVQNSVGNVGSASYPLASLSSSSSTYNVEETPPVSVAFPVEVPATSTAFAATQNMFVLPDSGQTQSSVFYENNDSQADDLYAAAIASAEAGEKIGEIPTEGNVDLFSSLSSELLSSSNNYWDVINNCDAGSLSLNYDLDVAGLNKPDERVVHSSLDDFNFAPEGPASKTQESASDETACNVPLEEICLNIINDLNEYGICVIDNFLGEKLGDLIAAEVKSLFLKGIFKKGELARSGMWRSNENIRGDVITWVDGNEPNCRYIGSLIRKLDVVMTACNKMPDNGILSKYKLNRRTKAMIACYPGDGTHYKKHVDNPNGDGRCITCIYYLNKKWDTKVHGGLLRMFPVGHENEVANIEPTFDRMLFFWSDRRNPHEVLPSYAVSYCCLIAKNSKCPCQSVSFLNVRFFPLAPPEVTCPSCLLQLTENKQSFTLPHLLSLMRTSLTVSRSDSVFNIIMVIIIC